MSGQSARSQTGTTLPAGSWTPNRSPGNTRSTVEAKKARWLPYGPGQPPCAPRGIQMMAVGRPVSSCWVASLVVAVLGAACSGEARPTGPSVPLTAPTGEGDTRIKNYEGNAFKASQGSRYFGWYGCQGCHSTGDRQLDLGMAPRRHGSTFVAVYAFIAHGHGPDIKTQAERLPIEQLWQITAYVGTLPTLDAERQRRQDMDAAAEARAFRPARPLQ